MFWKQDTDNLTRRDLEAAEFELSSLHLSERVRLPGKPMEDTGREGNRTGPQALFRVASCRRQPDTTSSTWQVRG